jgi:hypothetical protein
MPLTKIQSLGITDGTIVNADINASAAITLAKLSGVNDAKAWVNFNGTGTVAIRASFNVTSITDNGTGTYTVNFTTAMSDANFCVQVTPRNEPSQADFGSISNTDFTTTTARVVTWRYNGTQEDCTVVCVSVFR